MQGDRNLYIVMQNMKLNHILIINLLGRKGHSKMGFGHSEGPVVNYSMYMFMGNEAES